MVSVIKPDTLTQTGRGGRDANERVVAIIIASVHFKEPRISPKFWSPTARHEVVRKATVDIYQFHHVFAYVMTVGCRRRVLAKFLGDPEPDPMPPGGVFCCDNCEYRSSEHCQQLEVGWEVAAILTAIEAGAGSFKVADVVAVGRGNQPKRSSVGVPTSKYSCSSFAAFSDKGANPRTEDWIFNLLGSLLTVEPALIAPVCMERERLGGLQLAQGGRDRLRDYPFTSKLDDFRGSFKLEPTFAYRKETTDPKSRGSRIDRQRGPLMRALLAPMVRELALKFDLPAAYVLPDAAMEHLATLDSKQLAEQKHFAQHPLLVGAAFEFNEHSGDWPTLRDVLLDIVKLSNTELKEKVGGAGVQRPALKAPSRKRNTSGKDEKKSIGPTAAKPKRKKQRKQSACARDDSEFSMRLPQSAPLQSSRNERLLGALYAKPAASIASAPPSAPSGSRGNRQLAAARRLQRAAAERSRNVLNLAEELDSVDDGAEIDLS